MPNPYLPAWEYIPDGEPRVFGGRVYVYGSHDNAGSDKFCDYKLKVWSAPVDDLGNWACHGDAFHTRADRDHPSDTDWTDNHLYAPDVVEKDGKYYLYAYIVGARGCVAVSERPEGPFTLVSAYQYKPPVENAPPDYCDNGIFIDPGVLVDDDGKVYVYCGFTKSFGVALNADNMYEAIDATYVPHIIPVEPPFEFFEACSPRKVGDTYYMIYSPKKGSCLAYATSKKPLGPYTYGGIIIDNAQDYPGGNNHGSICQINGQWYIFYHRMTNNSIFSRRACVERIEMLSDGSIPQVEMTSLGFETSLSPYNAINADTACVLKGGCFITEFNTFTRPVTAITDGCIIGWKYFDFGDDFSSKTMEIHINVKGTGCNSCVSVLLDDPEMGTEIGVCGIGPDDGVYTAVIGIATGRHAVYLKISDPYEGWGKEAFQGRTLFNLLSLAFVK